MSNIPTKSREQVRDRSMGQCLRCGGRGYEWHHRRSRRVKDEHQHCACNGVWLCRTCHTWAHSQARSRAMELGFAVSAYAEPQRIPVYSLGGWWWLRCDGSADSILPADVASLGLVH